MGTALLSLGLAVVLPGTTRAQDRWESWTAVGGAALGAGAGAVVGTVGSVMPCTTTYAGPTCVRWMTAASALIGGVAGTVLGGTEPGTLGAAAVGGMVGLGVGGLVGAFLVPFIERWALEDALALGLIGGAVGTAPLGAAIGFGGGALVGVTLWRAVPDVGAPGAAALALGGLAAGVLAEWIVRAVAADAGGSMAIGLHVRF